jgi:DNA-directed RNA polymerase specialized sigma24 family protein
MTAVHTIPTTDFNSFYEAWNPKIQVALRQAGFFGDSAEDLSQDIFSDLFRGDYLSKYDSEKATFATYIWGHVQVRIRGRKRDFAKRGQREFVSDPIETKETTDRAVLRQSSSTDGAKMAELKTSLASVYQDLRTLPSTETKNLARLFKEIVSSIQSEGSFSQAELAAKLGYSRQAISSQIRDLAKTRAARELYDILKSDS